MKDWNTEAGRIQVPLGEQTLTTEVAGDFSLPDYQPEIKRLLRIGVSVLPPNRYAGNGSMDLGGTLDYYVLYMGNDNGLYCAPLSADYRLTAEVGGAGARDGWEISEPLVCTCDATAEAPIGRVTAPRRLNIRCRVNARVRMYAESSVGYGGSSSDAVERLTDEAEASRLLWGMGDAIPLQDDMILTPAEGGEWRVVCAEGSALITEAMAGMGMVNCRGEATVKLTLCPSGVENENGEGEAIAPTVTYRKIPFAESVELEGVTPGCECCARAVCASLSVVAEDGHLHIDVGVLPEVMAQANEGVRYTKDMYSTRRKSTERYATYPTEQGMRAFNGNFTLSDSMSLEEAGMDPSARVVDVSAVATPEALAYDRAKERCVLSGTCRAQLLLLRDGEYGSAEMALPFRYEFDARAGGAPHTMGMDGDPTAIDVPISYSGGVQVLHCRVRMDGERVGLDAELAVCLRTAQPSTLTVLTDMTEGEEVTRGKGEYVICFPSPNDSVWSVAKRYHAPLAVLGAANNLQPAPADAPESLDGVNYLIV